jgi:hypothetical protein
MIPAFLAVWPWLALVAAAASGMAALETADARASIPLALLSALLLGLATAGLGRMMS